VVDLVSLNSSSPASHKRTSRHLQPGVPPSKLSFTGFVVPLVTRVYIALAGGFTLHAARDSS